MRYYDNDILLPGERASNPNLTERIIPDYHPEYLKTHNYLGEFKTSSEKALARKNLGIKDTSVETRWGLIKGDIYLLEDLLEYLENTQDYTNEDYLNIETIKDALDFLLYKDLKISISSNPGIVEKGKSIDSIIYTWDLSKTNIKSIIFDGLELDPTIRSITIQGPFSENIFKTLEVTDAMKTFKALASTVFYPGIYYGASENYNSILNLKPLLLSNRKCTINMNATSGLYLWVMIPKSYGIPVFSVGGFEGGFTLVNDSFTHPMYETVYRIYRSDHPNLGNTTVNIA